MLSSAAEPPRKGAPALGGEPSVSAVRVHEAVRVDGLLDDPVWSRAEPASGFRQREPKEGEAATEATEVRVLYDDSNLYVGVRVLDRCA